MTSQDFEKRKERADIEPLVFSRTEEGIKVYSARDPKKSYLVSGTPEAPTCTCPDFGSHAGDAQWRYKHILLTSSQLYKWHTERAGSDTYDEQERNAIQEEGRQPAEDHPPAEKTPPAEPVSANSSSQMLIKRSVSPDGRIDSLSVEFACPVEKIPVKDIKERAIKTLQLQSDIVETFLNGRKNGNGKEKSAPDADGAIPATLVSVGGMDGKFGRRLFITVQANGQDLRLFGNKKQLGEHLTAVGCGQLAGRIAEGLQINANCRILTQASQNGKYTDITQVLPAGRRER
jgi:hypothetical protein